MAQKLIQYIVTLSIRFAQMNKFLLFITFTFVSTLGISQRTVFEETFDSNDQYWLLPNSTMNEANFSGSRLVWKHGADHISSVEQYINRLDDQEDFNFSITIRPLKVGSEYGIIFGGINASNANYLLIKNKKYRYLQLRESKVESKRDFKNSLAIKLDENTITIKKKDDKITYYINDTKLFDTDANVLIGKSFGIAINGNSKISADDFLIEGTKLPINLAKDMYYAEEPENLGKNINSIYEELTPVISPNGKGIYFSRRYSPGNSGGSSDHQDIYYSELFENEWTKAFNIGSPLNNHGPNAVCSVTPDGNKLLLINTYTENGKQKGKGLSMSHKTSTGWSVPKDVKIQGYYNNSLYNEFVLSNDGKVLLLSLDRDDTYGNRDLYVSFLQSNGIWTEPKNLGKDINTGGLELSPFLASDGTTLYFSSTGHPGYGKNDIFMTKRLDDTWTSWSEPINLGEPLNSVGRDAYYSVPADGEYAYYVSTDQAIGKNDIFRIKLPTELKPEPVVIIRGYVYNSKTEEPIATGIEYDDLESGEEAGIANSNPATGYYEIVLPMNKVYSFFAEKEGFYSVRDNIDLTDSSDYQVIERDLYLTPIEVGQSVQLNNVFFYRGKATLRSESYAELDELAAMLLENENIEIMLEGHTDNQGSAEKNIELSEQRVNTVKKYLIEKGVDESRIDGIGYGGAKPKASNAKEETRKLNRRVEFKIVKY